MLSSQCKSSGTPAVRAVINTCICMFSHSGVAYICVFWEKKIGARASFDHVLWSFWRHYLGLHQRNIPFVPKTLFAEVYS